MTNQSEFAYVTTSCTVREITFQIGVRADPSLNNIESFAAILFFELEDGQRREVAKIDNVEHEEGTIHIDRYYRESGADKKDFDIDISTVFEAEEYLDENAPRFARRYLDNYGPQ